jgi:hypothetical protein
MKVSSVPHQLVFNCTIESKELHAVSHRSTARPKSKYVLFYKRKTFLASVELLQKIIPYLILSESMPGVST